MKRLVGRNKKVYNVNKNYFCLNTLRNMWFFAFENAFLIAFFEVVLIFNVTSFYFSLF